MELSFRENSSVSYAAFLPVVGDIYMLTGSPSLSGTAELILQRVFLVLSAPRPVSCAPQAASVGGFQLLQIPLISGQGWKKNELNTNTKHKETDNETSINCKMSCV